VSDPFLTLPLALSLALPVALFVANHSPPRLLFIQLPAPPSTHAANSSAPPLLGIPYLDDDPHVLLDITGRARAPSSSSSSDPATAAKDIGWVHPLSI